MMSTAMIHGKLPSLNEYISACRTNRYAGAKMKREAEELIIWQLSPIPQISVPVIVNFTWYEQNRRRDKDNVAFAKKFVLDALQSSGKLPNDNNEYIAGFSDRFVYGKGYGVKIEVIPFES